MWSVESWTDHLREAARLSEEDRATLGRANAYRYEQRPARYIAVDPHEGAGRAMTTPVKRGL